MLCCQRARRRENDADMIFSPDLLARSRLASEVSIKTHDESTLRNPNDMGIVAALLLLLGQLSESMMQPASTPYIGQDETARCATLNRGFRFAGGVYGD